MSIPNTPILELDASGEAHELDDLTRSTKKSSRRAVP
jgi:hypothetical protein